MNKQEQIEKKLATPIEVGNEVQVYIEYTESSTTGKGKNLQTVENKKTKSGYGKVLNIMNHHGYGRIYSIKGDNISIPSELKLNVPNGDWYKAEWVKQITRKCGANPFKPSPRINFLNQDIGSILSKCGYGRKSYDYSAPEYNTVNGNSPGDKPYIGCTYGGTNFDPIVIDANGEVQHYQRGFVWTLEQKQLLIESIYSGIEIGKFLFRRRSWDYLAKQMTDNGHGFNYDSVDGKQRFHALLEFVQDKFPDLHGNFYSDLSEAAQSSFMNYNKLAIGEMDETTTDSDVVAAFLHLNFTGTPMSKEHIEHVQKIKI